MATANCSPRGWNCCSPVANEPAVAGQEEEVSAKAQADMDELAGLKPGALSKRAVAAGATAEALEQAQDDDEPKAALIDLILRLQTIPEAIAEKRGLHTTSAAAGSPTSANVSAKLSQYGCCIYTGGRNNGASSGLLKSVDGVGLCRTCSLGRALPYLL